MPREDSPVPDQVKAPSGPVTRTAGGDAYSPIMSMIGQNNAELDAYLKQHQAEMGSAQQHYRDVSSAPVPPPRLMALPERRPQGNADVMQAFAQPASIIALFGSLLTKRPMTAAIKSAAAAMQGYAQGNQEAVERAEKSWKDNLELALQQNSQEIEAYRVAMDKHQNDVNAALAEITASATTFHDELAINAAKSGNIQMVAQMTEARQRMQIEAQNHLDMMEYRRDALAVRQQSADQLDVHRRVQEDLGREKLGLLKGKTADTVKAKASELQSLSDQVGEIADAITKDPTLGGAYGGTRRLIGETVGQVFSGAQDKAAADFASKIENLQAKLTKPYLGAHYFTGNSADEMEKLVKGLDWRDDTATTLASLEALKEQLDSQVGGISAAATDVTTDSGNLMWPGAPPVGSTDGGYTYNGGNPADPNSWSQ